ncbi:MAG: hypothetical protein IIA03_04785, partial [Proteobacteria bacterium]|nr:hypothetical protein [Pseudomonadota bacterium]
MAVALRKIRTPLKQQWRQFRYRFLPVVVFSATVAATAWLWQQHAGPSGLDGRAEAKSANITARVSAAILPLPGTAPLERNSVVEQGQLIVELDATLLDKQIEGAKFELARRKDQIESILGLSVDQLRANRVMATAVSGLRSAVIQLQAESDGVSLTEALGGTPTESVQLYANINRGLFATDRTPDAFFRMAERAREAGFTTFKCAPFDEVSPPSSPDRILDEAAPGLDRV